MLGGIRLLLPIQLNFRKNGTSKENEHSGEAREGKGEQIK